MKGRIGFLRYNNEIKEFKYEPKENVNKAIAKATNKFKLNQKNIIIYYLNKPLNMNNTFGSIGFQDYDIFDIITTRDQEVQVKLEHSPRISSDDDIEIDGFSSSEDEMEAEKLPEHIDDLLAMGFDKDTSAAALSVTHGDVNAAVSLILSGNVSHFEKPKQPVKVIKETEITPEFLAHGWKDHFRDCMDSSDALNEFVAEIARYDPELHYYLAQNQDILDEFIYDE